MYIHYIYLIQNIIRNSTHKSIACIVSLKYIKGNYKFMFKVCSNIMLLHDSLHSDKSTSINETVWCVITNLIYLTPSPNNKAFCITENLTSDDKTIRACLG